MTWVSERTADRERLPRRRFFRAALGHGVDCGVDSPSFPATLAPKAAGQITRIVYVIRDFAGLECDVLSA